MVLTLHFRFPVTIISPSLPVFKAGEERDMRWSRQRSFASIRNFHVKEWKVRLEMVDRSEPCERLLQVFLLCWVFSSAATWRSSCFPPGAPPCGLFTPPSDLGGFSHGPETEQSAAWRATATRLYPTAPLRISSPL